MRIMQTFLNVVEFGMNIQLAIEAPRWTTSSFPSSTFPHGMKPAAIGLETRISEEVRAELKKRGHRIRMRGPWTVGATCAIVVDPKTGVLSAGGDPRGDNTRWRGRFFGGVHSTAIVTPSCAVTPLISSSSETASPEGAFAGTSAFT